MFWTTSEGTWEGAKVRDLVDALDGGTCEEDGNGSGDGDGEKNGKDYGMFVTKHEVLQLRRMMGL